MADPAPVPPPPTLTEQQREMYVCCLKPRLCTEGHYHGRDVARMIADERERVAQAIEAEFARWDALSESRAPHPLHSTAWFVERSYADAALIARGGAA